MKKVLFIITTLLIGANMKAQVGVGTTSPAGALDITSTNDGLLIPRIVLTATNVATVTTPTESELVYNTATSAAGPNQVTPGFYYWNGTLWVRVGAGSSNDWALTGNSGTTPGTNFIGTTDDTDIRIKTGTVSTDRWNISHANNGQLQSFSLGTALLPTYSWQTDTNTGIWSPLADNIATSTTGIERTRILANGDMGIGTSAPTHRLTVKNDIANVGVMNIDNANSAGFGGIYFSEGPFSGTNYRGHIGHVNSTSGFAYPGTFQIAAGDRDLLFSSTNGSNSFTEIIRIENATGYVGINTNPLNLSAGIPLPTSTLHVNGSLAVGILKITSSTDLTSLTEEVSKVVINNGGSNITIDLPNPTTCAGRLISFTRGESSTGTITLNPNGSNNIQNLAGTISNTTTILAHSASGAGVNIQFWSDGVNWYR